MIFTITFVSLLASNAFLLSMAQVPPLFSLICGDYPDICDNHCNAFTCHDLESIHLHYDATSDAGEGDKRRTAIGCGPNNYCASGTDCDEYPYASTYDGGLGCYPDGYNGGEQLAQSGTTRCSDPSQNSRHGQALGQFYSDKALQNGDVFFVGVSGSSPLCDSLATSGVLACPPEDTGDYRFRSTPATPSCPARGSRRDVIPGMRKRETRSSPVKIRTVTTALNQTIRVFGEGEGLEVGGSVWAHDAQGRGYDDVIVKIEE